MNKRKVKIIRSVALAVFCFSCCIPAMVAQTVKTFIDRQDILIGEQIRYKVVATTPAGAFSVRWLNLPDSMPHFELVEKTKIDTLTQNGSTVLEQTLILTSFDSGRWSTPAFMIHFDPSKNGNAVDILTDSFDVNVGYAAADSTNELRDIKPIIDVKVRDYWWYYVAAGALVLLLAAFFLWRYFKNRAKKPGPKLSGKLTAFEEALQELEKLKQFNLQQPEAVKQLHTKLAAIFKWYISRKQQFSIMNKTTGDVLVHLSGERVPKEIIAETATALRMGDAVKFAKYLPSPAESSDCIEKIKAAIFYIHQPQTIHNQP